MDQDFTTPEELKMIALQFMGQQIGELKELDKNIISKTNTLQGNQLNVQEVLKTLPQTQQRRTQPQQVQQRVQPNIVQNVLNNNSSTVEYFDKILSKLDTIIKLLEK